jgi:ribosomal 50S subunit-recycling heat shock protein
MDNQVFRLEYHDSQPQRLDKYLVLCLPEYSRARLQGLIKSGKILVNETPARKAGQMVENGDILLVMIPPSKRSIYNLKLFPWILFLKTQM